MGPKFDDPLYFQKDKSLDVCGPTGFRPNDVQLRITQLRIKDKNGTVMEPDLKKPLLLGSSDEMWEADIPGAAGKLKPGPAHGFGSGEFIRQNGSRRPVQWANELTLVDPPKLFAGKT